MNKWSVAAIVGGIVVTAAVVYGIRNKNKSLLALTETPLYKVTGPMVSIVIPTLQEEDYLQPLLVSITNQTYEPLEVIISDSSPPESKQATQDLISRWKLALNIRMVDSPIKNISMGRNAGAKAAKGPILLFIDADCIMEPTYVEKLAGNLDNGAILAHGLDCWYDNDVLNSGKSFFSWLKPRMHTTGRGVLVRKEDFDAVDGYREDCDPFIMKCREDIDFGARIEQTFGPGSVYLNRNAVVGESKRRALNFKSGETWPERGWRKGKAISRALLV